jgi:hypothetical protein
MVRSKFLGNKLRTGENVENQCAAGVDQARQIPIVFENADQVDETRIACRLNTLHNRKESLTCSRRVSLLEAFALLVPN